MKQHLTLQQKLRQTKTFNAAKASSLHILAMSNDELLTYIKNEVQHTPFLEVSTHTKPEFEDVLAYDQSLPSLYDEIMEQLRFSKEQPNLEICEIFISNLDSNGYFRCSKETLRNQIHASDQEYKRNLTILRKCEPYGCFAFNLKECLKLQCILSTAPISTTALLLCDDLEAIALGNMQSLFDKTKLDKSNIEEALTFIKTLHPKPAANYSTEVQYINPEFKIKVIDNHIQIQLLHDDLEVNLHESDHLQPDILKSQRQYATTLMSYIKRRNVTMMQIMQYICDQQKKFFLHYDDLVHCTLTQIAQALGVHASTISRAIHNKSCEFEHAYYPLSYFLSSGGSKQHSQAYIQTRIKDLIAQEDKSHPLSDEQLRLLLSKEQIVIARRTVTKYRETCFIYNSTKRKKQV